MSNKYLFDATHRQPFIETAKAILQKIQKGEIDIRNQVFHFNCKLKSGVRSEGSRASYRSRQTC
jgi:hypothetical protein